jgi:hypothetical protein
MTVRRLLTGLLVAAVVTIAACGGGGGDAGTSPFNGGGGAPAAPTASDLSLTLSAPTINNGGSESVVVTATAVDANRNTVANIPVTFSVDAAATIQVSGTATTTSGQITGTVGIGSDRSNRTITVRAVSGNITREAAIRVIGTRITATALPAVLAPGQAGTVQYNVVDSAGVALASTQVSITGPGGTASTGTTGLNGDFVFAYTAPANTGNLNIRANAAGIESITTVLVQSGTSTLPSVPLGSVRSATVRANPSVVAVNAGTSTINRAEVRALFVGNSNAPVANVRVRFDLDGDTNSIGGTFASGSNLVYSDANGIALTSYIPGNRFSPTDGVTLRACWDYNDFAPGTCPNAARTTVTVISEALSVTIGSDELIVIGDLVYVKRFIVQVNDSSGLAKPDVQISPLLDLPVYSKGAYTRVGASWVRTTSQSCDNEDLNRNGVLEVYSNGGVEDANGNGALDPRKADVAVAFEGSSRTNSAGQLILRITYPKSVASWIDYDLTVAASGVAGTEGRATFSGTLPVPVAAITDAGAPAFRVSPYGTNTSSAVSIVSTPDGRAQGALCGQ